MSVRFGIISFFKFLRRTWIAFTFAALALHTAAFAPFVRMRMGPDIDQCRMAIKHELALYVGGMGAREKNFYNDYTKRLGYEEAAVKIQDLYLSGRREEAAAAVPDQYVDDCSLVGPPEHIKEQLTRWQEAGRRGEVTTMVVGAKQAEELRLLAETLL